MHGVPNRALGHVVRVALGCYRALVAFGSCWLPLPEDQLRRILYGESEDHGPETGTADTSPSEAPITTTAPIAPAPVPTPAPPAGGRGATTTPRAWATTPGPPPGHPERLCVEVPLSDLERRLARQLKGV
ncbi:DUF6059 family protein [Streptomyces sp. NPDC050842]|uniref:DUF6059 family protein n=1 Tax=Streptomyces sp. NPDC050842 TaxID=3365636 RepID=UPI00378A7DB8